MSSVIYETFDSRSVSVDSRSPGGSMKWIGRAASDEEMLVLALATAPLTFPNVTSLIRTDVSLEPEGGGIWKVTATYGILEAEAGSTEDLPAQGGPEGSEPPPQAEPITTQAIGGEFSFTTAGGTQRVQLSEETIDSRAKNGAAAPNHAKSINVTKSGVEGVDIVVPNFEWSVTRIFAGITLKYLRTLTELTGTMNDAVFYGFKAGELLFLGADGQYRGPDGESNAERWVITFKFSASFNNDDYEFTDDIPGPADPDNPAANPRMRKRGHDYAWAMIAETENGGRVVQQAVAGYIEQVYKLKDFRRLGI